MPPDQRLHGPRHRRGWRRRGPAWVLPPQAVPVGADDVDRPGRGVVPHRGERLHLRALRGRGAHHPGDARHGAADGEGRQQGHTLGARAAAAHAAPVRAAEVRPEHVRVQLNNKPSPPAFPL